MPIHNRFVLVAIGRTADVAILDVNFVFGVGLDIEVTTLFFRAAVKEGLASSLPRPVINNLLSIDPELDGASN